MDYPVWIGLPIAGMVAVGLGFVPWRVWRRAAGLLWLLLPVVIFFAVLAWTAVFDGPNLYKLEEGIAIIPMYNLMWGFCAGLGYAVGFCIRRLRWPKP